MGLWRGVWDFGEGCGTLERDVGLWRGMWDFGEGSELATRYEVTSGLHCHLSSTASSIEEEVLGDLCMWW